MSTRRGGIASASFLYPFLNSTTRGLISDPSAEAFCYAVEIQLALDPHRIKRILQSRSGGVLVRWSMPSIYRYQGDAGCWQKLEHLQHF